MINDKNVLQNLKDQIPTLIKTVQQINNILQTLEATDPSKPTASHHCHCSETKSISSHSSQLSGLFSWI